MFDATSTTPYIHVVSAEAESGKSRLLETLDDALRHMDRYPWHGFYPVRIHPDFLEQVLEAVGHADQ